MEAALPIIELRARPRPGFRRAVAEFCEQEARAVDEDIEILTSMGPFKRG